MAEATEKDPLGRMAQERGGRIKAHARLMKSKEFREQQERLSGFILEFIGALNASWLMATRMPTAIENCLLFRRLDDVIESALAIRALAADGMLYAARREQRYLLEALTKYLATDQLKPDLEFKQRVGFFEREIAKRSIGPIDGVQLVMLSAGGASRFKQEVRQEFDRLSSFVHASVEQIRARNEEAKRGVYIGFETVTELEAFVDEAYNVFGLALVLVLHGLGRPLTGDLFTNLWDDQELWPFAGHPFIAETSAAFDYKQERQSK